MLAPMERAPRQPEPERAASEDADEAGEREPAPRRCPYCKADLGAAELTTACARCGTGHHVACFAEHLGCATHGCGSTEALSPRPPARLLALAPVVCATCRLGVPIDALAAACRNCGHAQHAPCYERVGRCSNVLCRDPFVVDLLPASRLRERVARREARAFTWVAALLTGPLAALFLVGGVATREVPPLVLAPLFVLLTAVLVRAAARRGREADLAAAVPWPPRPAGPGAARPAAKSVTTAPAAAPAPLAGSEPAREEADPARPGAPAPPT